METIFSVIKKKFEETLRAKKFRNQVKEIKIKLRVYNINKKFIEIIWIKLGFLQSRKKVNSELALCILFLNEAKSIAHHRV